MVLNMNKLILPEVTEVELSFKEFLALEMAMGDRKVLNIPILFDNNDLEFLHQFPTTCPKTNTDLWTLALKWRYGEGLLQVSEHFSSKWRSQGGKPEDVDMSDFPDEQDVIFYEWKDIGPTGAKVKKKAFKFNFGKKKTGSLKLFNILQDKDGLDMDLTDPIRKAAASEEELDKYIAKTKSGEMYEPEERDEPAHFNETVTTGQYQSMLRNLTIWALSNQNKIITSPDNYQGKPVVEKEVNMGLGKGKKFTLPTIETTVNGYKLQILENIGKVGAGKKLAFEKGSHEIESQKVNVPVLGKGRFIIPITTDRSKFLKELFGYHVDTSFRDFFSLDLIDSSPGVDDDGKSRMPRTVETLIHTLTNNVNTLNISSVWLNEIIERVLKSENISTLNMGNLCLALNPKSAISQWGKKRANLRKESKGDKGESSQKLDLSNLLYNWNILSDQDKEILKTPVNTENRIALIKAGKQQKNKLTDPEAEQEEDSDEGLAKWAAGFFQPSKGISRQGSQNWADVYGTEKSNLLGELQMKYFSKALHIIGNERRGWIHAIGDRELSTNEKNIIPAHHEDFAAAMASGAINLDINKTLAEINSNQGITARGTNIMYNKLDSILQKASKAWDTGTSAQEIVGSSARGGENKLGDTLPSREGPLSASGEGKIRKGLKSDVWLNKFQKSLAKRFSKNDEAFLKTNLLEIEDDLKRIKSKFLDDEIKNFGSANDTPEIRSQLEKSAESKALMYLIPYIERKYKDDNGNNFKFMSIKTAPDFMQALEMIRGLSSSSRGGEVEDAKNLDQLMDLSDYSPKFGTPDIKDHETKKLKEFSDTLSFEMENSDEINVLDWIDDAKKEGLNSKEIENKLIPNLLAIKEFFSNVEKNDMEKYWVQAMHEIKNELKNIDSTPSPAQAPVSQPTHAPAPTPLPQKPAIDAGRDEIDIDTATDAINKCYQNLRVAPQIVINRFKSDPNLLGKLPKWGMITKNEPRTQMMYNLVVQALEKGGVKLEMSLPMGTNPSKDTIGKIHKCANVWGVPNNSTGVSAEEPKRKFKSLKEYLEDHSLDSYKQRLMERVERNRKNGR